LGDITLKAGAKDLANDEFDKALKLAEEYSNEHYQIQAILNKVILVNDPVKLDSVLNIANKKFAYDENNNYSLSQIKYCLGLLYANNKQTEEALSIFYDLLQSETYDEQDKAEVYKGIGIAYRNQKKFELAINYFDTALHLVEDKTIMQLEVLIEKAQVFSLAKEYNKLKNLIYNIKPTLDSLKDLSIKKRINELHIEICDHAKDMQEKAEKLIELQMINKKIDEDSKALLVSILRNLSNLELRKEKKAQEAQKKYLKILLALATLLFVSITTSLILFYKHIQLALKSFNRYFDRQGTELKRLAGELHDILATNLAATRLQFLPLKEYIPVEKYEKILKMLTNNIKETRGIAHNIIPPVLVNSGLITAIKTKLELWNNDSLQFELISSVEEVTLYDELKFDLYRCALECINNIIRYAKASEVTIEITLRDNDQLQITIKDNGVGFDTNEIEKGKGGLGIRGMSSRIQYFKGKFQIHSKNGEGTKVNILVPVKRDTQKENTFNLTKRLSKILKVFYTLFFKKDSIQDI